MLLCLLVPLLPHGCPVSATKDRLVSKHLQHPIYRAAIAWLVKEVLAEEALNKQL